jgi:hypothetical protein
MSLTRSDGPLFHDASGAAADSDVVLSPVGEILRGRTVASGGVSRYAGGVFSSVRVVAWRGWFWR